MGIDEQVFDLAGPHYDLGHAQGARTERFQVPAWWPPPPPLAFARECAAHIAAVHPPLLDELRGYADSQGLPFDDLLRGVCRRSMRLRAAPPPGAHYPEGGCSSLAVVDAAGHTRVGRNYDFHAVQRVRQRLRLRPAAGRPSLGMRGSVPGGRYDGVNDAGLFVCLHVALSDEPAEHAPGIPFHLLPRLALETCTNTAEAVDLLTRVRHLHPFNYLIADAAGDLAVVEAHPEGGAVVAARGEPFAAATNHYCHPRLAAYQRGRRLDHSQGRLEALHRHGRALRQMCGAQAAEGVRAALRDHAARLCGHAGGHTTLWSLAADLTARQVAYARGSPCEAAFEDVPWPEEAAGSPWPNPA